MKNVIISAILAAAAFTQSAQASILCDKPLAKANDFIVAINLDDSASKSDILDAWRWTTPKQGDAFSSTVTNHNLGSDAGFVSLAFDADADVSDKISLVNQINELNGVIVECKVLHFPRPFVGVR